MRRTCQESCRISWANVNHSGLGEMAVQTGRELKTSSKTLKSSDSIKKQLRFSGSEGGRFIGKGDQYWL